MRESAWSMLLAVQMFLAVHYISLFPFLWGEGGVEVSLRTACCCQKCILRLRKLKITFVVIVVKLTSVSIRTCKLKEDDYFFGHFLPVK